MARLLQLTDPEKINQRLAETLYSEGPFIVRAADGQCDILARVGNGPTADHVRSTAILELLVHYGYETLGLLADIRKTCDFLNAQYAAGNIEEYYDGRWSTWSVSPKAYKKELTTPTEPTSKPLDSECKNCIWQAAPYAKTSGCGAPGGRCDRAKTEDLADCWQEAEDRQDLERRLLGLVEAVDQQDLGRGIVQLFGQVLPDGRDERQWVFLGPGPLIQ